MAKILFVEDDQDLATTIVAGLTRQQNHVVDHCSDGSEGLFRATTYQFDLIIVDWQLPGMAGIDLIERYRSAGGCAPILMLTGKGATIDKTNAFHTGCDDYLTKPFAFPELAARVMALLRRPPTLADKEIRVGDLYLDTTTCVVTRGGERFDLNKQEFVVLEFLMRHPNQLLTSSALLERVWSCESTASEGAVRMTILRLRKKLDVPSSKQSLIENVRGLGYRLVTTSEKDE